MSEFTILFQKRNSQEEGVLNISIYEHDEFHIRIKYSRDSPWNENKLHTNIDVYRYISTFLRSIAYGREYKQEIDVIAMFLPITKIHTRTQRRLFYHMFDTWLILFNKEDNRQINMNEGNFSD